MKQDATNPQAHREVMRRLPLQPYVVAALVALGIALQAPVLFFGLAAALAWNVLFPAWNPFERFYDSAIGTRQGLAKLQPAPAPRRFAQGMAATFMLVGGVALSLGWRTTAYVFEGFLVVALGALLAGKFCLGSYIYHLLRGRAGFASVTCPWSRE